AFFCDVAGEGAAHKVERAERDNVRVRKEIAEKGLDVGERVGAAELEKDDADAFFSAVHGVPFLGHEKRFLELPERSFDRFRMPALTLRRPAAKRTEIPRSEASFRNGGSGVTFLPLGSFPAGKRILQALEFRANVGGALGDRDEKDKE